MENSYETYKGFKIRYKDSQKILILENDRITESCNFMLKENISGLELNYVYGISDTDFVFLKDFNFVNFLSIINWWTKDISQIHNLTELHTLNIVTDCKTKIDFSQFPKLTNCILHWRSGATSLYKSTLLEDLCLFHYNPKEKNLLNLSNLKNLKKLQVNSSPINSLEGIENLQNIEKLELYYLRNLENIEHIKQLPKLKKLSMESCKKANLQAIAHLQQIEKLLLTKMADIESVKLFSELKNLQSLALGETKITDGNLSPMFDLPNLQRFIGKHYKHYSHSFEEITQKIAEIHNV